MNASLLSSRFANTPPEIGKPCKRDSSPGFLHASVAASGRKTEMDTEAASEQLALATKMAAIGFIFSVFLSTHLILYAYPCYNMCIADPADLSKHICSCQVD